MASPAADAQRRSVWNVPNQITAVRLVLSVLVFALIAWRADLMAMIVFVIAASTDWIDGYWARKYNQVTKLGRVFDPFVDKMIICGTFIFLAARSEESGVAAWMATVVMGREMLVTALRSFIERSGGDFSAMFSGKLKMVFQCAAVVAALLTMWRGEASPAWLMWTRDGLLYVAILSTLQSGYIYCRAAAPLLLNE